MDDKIDSVRRAITQARSAEYPFSPVKAVLRNGTIWFLDEYGNVCGAMHPDDWEEFPSIKDKYVWGDGLAD